MENKLGGKTAIVTGASRGIGKAIAIALGREKMRLALLARSTSKLQEVCISSPPVMVANSRC